LTSENEIVEFKEANRNYDFTKLGKYFSALCNEANLKRRPHAWLIFGVEDKNHDIIGSQFRPNQNDLNNLKSEIADHTLNRITFIEIYVLNESEGRVILFQIPAAPRGIPVSFKGHYYGRDNEQLVPLNLEEIERIRAQAISEDWSSGILANASILDLDEKAIQVARRNYKNKFSDKATEVDKWDDKTFLNKAKLTIKGKITRTTILLLGKEESEHFLNPSDPKIRWLLKDSRGNDKDYEIIELPFLLAVDKVYNKIRNLKYRYIKDETLFPEEVRQYEPYVIREALNNCIAHQDYTRQGRINIIEREDELIFTNLGEFIPGSVEKVVIDDAPEEHYRNRFLATAMFNLKMVDTAGGGIRKMFIYQRNKYFPLPEYDLFDAKVKVTISAKVLDIDYARILARNPDLSLEEIILLDKLPKNKTLEPHEITRLKSKNLIEGRKPNFYISKKLAKKTGQKAKYSKNKAFDKQYYFDLIKKAITKHEDLNRKDVDELLWNKLPEWMNDKKKKNKIGNLLSELRKDGEIINQGGTNVPKWVLRDK